MGSIQYVLVPTENVELQVYKLNAVRGGDLKRPKTRKDVNFQKHEQLNTGLEYSGDPNTSAIVL